MSNSLFFFIFLFCIVFGSFIGNWIYYYWRKIFEGLSDDIDDNEDIGKG